MRNSINAWLDTIPGLKTEKGAMKRLEKFLDIIVENDSKFMVYRKADGTFVPLVIASPKDYAIGAYAHNGICVTN
jgi:hypothetical protein